MTLGKAVAQIGIVFGTAYIIDKIVKIAKERS